MLQRFTNFQAWRSLAADQYETLMAHIESLETHVARLEGVLHVLLEQLEAGTIQETAADIRRELPRLDSD